MLPGTEYAMNPKDREIITHKYYQPEQPHDGYRRFTYLGYECDPATGLSDAELRRGVAELAERQLPEMNHALAKAEALEYVFSHTRIDVNDNDWYVGIHSWGRVLQEAYIDRWKKETYENKYPEVRALMRDLSHAGLCDTWLDYDHSVPDWDAIIGLGFAGMRERAKRLRAENEKKRALTDAQIAYYESIERTLGAILKLLERMIAYAEGKQGEKIPKIVTCLEHLAKGAPTDTYEALQLIYLYFLFSESFDCYQVRSLGNGFDRIVEPFYRRDLESGHAKQSELDDYIAYFLMQFYAMGNYWGQPLFLGGTHADGSTKYTPFAKRVLELWDALEIHNPKIQLLLGESTPREIRDLANDIIRRGKYLTYVCEDGTRRALKSAYGCTDEEARDFIVSGCYEILLRGGTLILGGFVNLAEVVNLALRNGFDPKTQKQIGAETGKTFADFEAFYAAFEAQMHQIFRTTRDIVNHAEQYLPYINPSILLSATKEESLRRMEDGYSMSDTRSASTIQISAFATAVDSLAYIKKAVFEEKTLSMEELLRALDADWVGYEDLQRKAKKAPKYGNNDPYADAVAKRVSLSVSEGVKPLRNLRGGKFLVEYHAAMEYAWQGKRTEATPDGRPAGAELSKNASPVVGADRKGATAFLLSCTAAIAPEDAAAGFNADVMLHPSALEGEEGLRAMDALIQVYRKRGGIDIQFNVLNPETLRDAQKHPEKYQNLQIRVSGWNVLWNDIPAELQEGYIRRAETVTGD